MWALIVDNRVAEVHATKPESHADLNWIETELPVEPGCTYENGVFVSLADQQQQIIDAEAAARADLVPQVISKFQAKMILHAYGLLPAVDAVMADPATDITARLAWEDAQEFRRHSPTIAAMAAMLDLSSEQLDTMFKQAAQIEA